MGPASRQTPIVEFLELRRLMAQVVQSFTLINADTDLPIAGYETWTGGTLDLQSLPTSNLNVVANTNPSLVGSVRFALDANTNFRTESGAPYSLAGDSNGDYAAWTPAVGSHTLKATPYTGASAGGTVGTPLTINFDVTIGSSSGTPVVTVAATDASAAEASSNNGVFTISRTGSTASSLLVNFLISGTATNGSDYQTISNTVTIDAGDSSATVVVDPIDDPTSEGSEIVTLTLQDTAAYNLGSPFNSNVTIADNDAVAGQAVLSFTLINADTGQVIPGFENWTGQTIDFVALGITKFNVTANVNTSAVGSVRFKLDGTNNFKTDNSAPFQIATTSWTPAPGNHLLKATPWTLDNAKGKAGTSLQINFFVSNGWNSGQSLPFMVGEVAGGIIGNKMYILDEDTADMAAFNLTNQTWETNVADRLLGFKDSSSEVVNGKLYVIGGVTKVGATQFAHDEVQIYDPTTNSWSFGTSLPFNVLAAQSCAIGNFIYLAGGVGDANSTLNQLWRYNTTNNTWTQLANMKAGRNSGAAGTDGSKFYIFGGRTGGNSPSNGFNTVQVYDPGTNTWIASTDSSGPGKLLKPLPQARGGVNNAPFVNGKFYVIGGETVSGAGATSNDVYNRVDIYTVGTNTWTLGPQMPTARHGILPLDYNGKIYVAGGGVVKAKSESDILEILSL